MRIVRCICGRLFRVGLGSDIVCEKCVERKEQEYRAQCEREREVETDPVRIWLNKMRFYK